MQETRNFDKWEPVIAAPLIKRFEGFRSAAYLCPAGVPTIGYGHTKGVHLGERVGKEEADRLLSADLSQFRLQLLPYVKVAVTRGQFIALMSFAYNLGAMNLRKSTLLKYLNEGRPDLAQKEFARWNKVNGEPSQGLTNRRAVEAAVFGGQENLDE